MVDQVTAERAISFGPFRLIPKQRLLLEGDQQVRLGSRALDLLIALVEHPGEVVGKDELTARVWPNTVVEEGNLKFQVSALRRTLGNGSRYLVNVPGRGYSFAAPVSRTEELRPAAPGVAPTWRAHNLPGLLTRLVGRADAVSRLAEQLPRQRLLTIVGPGGIGKTSVALAVADRLIAAYEHGVWLVDVAPLADPCLVPTALASVLGLEIRSDNPLPGLVAELADRRLLLVLDNCEHVIETAATLATAILRGAAGVRILATSREPLRVQGEHVQRLPPLSSGSPSGHLGAAEALAFPAIELFVERAAQSLDEFELTDDNAPIVADICLKLDGIPLAIELAAARVESFGVPGLATHLDDRFRLLTSGRRSGPPRHSTLRATLDWSYEVLPEVERAVLRRLGIFMGGFTLGAAASVAADPAELAAEIIDQIAELVTKSLVAADVGEAEPRLRLLETARVYALEKLAESGERERIARRHAEHYRSLFERAEGEAEARPSGDWLADYAREIDNLRAALDWSFSQDGDPSLGLNLIAASAPLWFRLSLNPEYCRRAERALRLLSDLPEQGSLVEMRLQIALGHALWYTQCDAELLQQPFARALELADRIGEAPDRLRLQALWGMWAARRGRGQYREALALAIRYEAVARSVGDQAFVLLADRILGLSHHFLGNQGLARQHTEQVRRVARGSENPPNTEFQLSPEVAAASLLTRILWLQGFPDQALAMLGEAIDAAERSGHRYSMSYVLTFAGCPASVWTGNLSDTQKYINMITDIGPGNVTIDQLTRCWSLVLRLRQGDERDVLIASYIEPRLDLSTLSEIVLLGSGSTITMPSPNDEVGDALWSLAEVLRVNAELLLWRDAPGAAEAAEAELLRSIDWARQHSALSWELRAATSLARLQRDLGRTREARDLLASVFGRFTEGFDTADLRTGKQLLDELADVARV